MFSNNLEHLLHDAGKHCIIEYIFIKTSEKIIAEFIS